MDPDPAANIEDAWPWMRGFRRIVRTVAQPRIAGTDLFSTSDFSGSHKESRFDVYCYVLIDPPKSVEWFRQMSDIRRIFLGERRMSFKALNDAKRQQALVPFLQVAECLHGVCCSIAVAKTVPHFATSPDTMSGLTDVMNLGGRWKEKTFETATRALLFWSVLISEVGEGQQNVTWLIDEDEIAANEPRHDDLLQLTARVGQHLIRRQMRELCVSTTATAGPNPMYEDFNAVADIAAGAFSEAVNRWTRRTSNDVSPDGTYDLFGHSGKCDLINDWFFFPSTTLRRVAVLVDHEPASGISIKRVGLQT